jgi:SAM-dependent methyltransferase
MDPDLRSPIIPFRCRSCGHGDGGLVLHLGVQPLANNLLLPADLAKPEPRFPLRLAVCQTCWLLQLVETVPPVQLFSEYLYFSSFSDAMLRHAREAADRYASEFNLGPASRVIEIASNDGYLLQYFKQRGIPCLGIEPAANIAKVSREKGIETLERFFDLDLAQELAQARRQADLILGNNVFAHVPDINGFVAGLKAALRAKGRIVLEFPYAGELVEKTEFDTIYHEHVFYFTLTPLRTLFQRHGLEVCHVEALSIHGGSLRLFASHQGVYPVRASVTDLGEQEARQGMLAWPFYANFKQRVEDLKSSLCSLLKSQKSNGKSVAAYGASAKGSTLLNYMGLGAETIDFVVDRSTYKQGRLTPGTHLLILPPEHLLSRRPDFTLLLTWNFANEILVQQKPYRDAGGRFIIPIPNVEVV